MIGSVGMLEFFSHYPWLYKPLRRWYGYLRLLFRVVRAKSNYARNIKRICQKEKGKKLRVLFIVSEIAKWKEQRLYELMSQSEDFEPIVGLSAWNSQDERFCSNDQLLEVHRIAEQFFARLGVRTVRTVMVVDGKRVISDLSEFRPDIVYYTEAWAPCGRQGSEYVSQFALTCYSPYYVPNYGDCWLDAHLDVHIFLWRYFCLNEYWCKMFAASFSIFDHVVRFVAVGHPALDFFSLTSNCVPHGKSVVYAPHFSFPHPKHDKLYQFYSTFDWNGREILAYAKGHPEIKWVFKPHPLLKRDLLMTGLMNHQEVDSYFNAWAEIGIVCTDGDYQELFMESYAMITDCGSFLTEYGATGHPLIHLICSQNCRHPVKPSKMVYDTYYQVRNLEEMYKTFQMVIEKGLDPKREERLLAVKRAKISDTKASVNIVEYLKRELKR